MDAAFEHALSLLFPSLSPAPHHRRVDSRPGPPHTRTTDTHGAMDRLKSPLKGSPRSSPFLPRKLMNSAAGAGGRKPHYTASSPAAMSGARASPVPIGAAAGGAGERPMPLVASPIPGRRRTSLSDRMRRTSSPRPGSAAPDVCMCVCVCVGWQFAIHVFVTHTLALVLAPDLPLTLALAVFYRNSPPTPRPLACFYAT